MSDTENLNEILTRLHELLSEYRHKIDEGAQHVHNEKHLDMIHSLREKISALEEARHKHAHNEAENTEQFLQHHLDAIRHANHHMHILHEEEEFELARHELYRLAVEMQELLEQLEAEKLAQEQGNRHGHYQGPEPNPYACVVED